MKWLIIFFGIAAHSLALPHNTAVAVFILFATVVGTILLALMEKTDNERH